MKKYFHFLSCDITKFLPTHKKEKINRVFFVWYINKIWKDVTFLQSFLTIYIYYFYFKLAKNKWTLKLTLECIKKNDKSIMIPPRKTDSPGHLSGSSSRGNLWRLLSPSGYTFFTATLSRHAIYAIYSIYTGNALYMKIVHHFSFVSKHNRVIYIEYIHI